MQKHAETFRKRLLGKEDGPDRKIPPCKQTKKSDPLDEMLENMLQTQWEEVVHKGCQGYELVEDKLEKLELVLTNSLMDVYKPNKAYITERVGFDHETLQTANVDRRVSILMLNIDKLLLLEGEQSEKFSKTADKNANVSEYNHLVAINESIWKRVEENNEGLSGNSLKVLDIIEHKLRHPIFDHFGSLETSGSPVFFVNQLMGLIVDLLPVIYCIKNWMNVSLLRCANCQSSLLTMTLDYHKTLMLYVSDIELQHERLLTKNEEFTKSRPAKVIQALKNPTGMQELCKLMSFDFDWWETIHTQMMALMYKCQKLLLNIVYLQKK